MRNYHGLFFIVTATEESTNYQKVYGARRSSTSMQHDICMTRSIDSPCGRLGVMLPRSARGAPKKDKTFPCSMTVPHNDAPQYDEIRDRR
jgi:hypothetical protein